MEAKLYVIPGSHPSYTCRLMLEHKGIKYQRVDLIPMIAKPYLRLIGFQASTVPALKIDRHKVQGSLNISRELERIKPLPSLYPKDSQLRIRVEEAERWGEKELQPIPRRMVWWCLRKDKAPLASFAEGANLRIPLGLAIKTSGPIIAASARYNNSTDDAVKADLAQLPKLLDHADRLIKEGVIGGEVPNAADFQIATSLRLLLCFEDLRPFLVRRPGKELAMRILPELKGNIRSLLPREWLATLSTSNSLT